MFGPDHGRPGLSFSAECWLLLNRGRLLDRRRIWRLRKPLFCVEKDGYPGSPAFFSLADSHMTGVAYPFIGLDRPLVLMSSPGLAQPPPGTGLGLRDRLIGVLGVPGIGERRDDRAWTPRFVSDRLRSSNRRSGANADDRLR